MTFFLVHQHDYTDHRRLKTRAHAEGRKIITQEIPRREVYHKSFRYKAASYWNDLPTVIHELKQTVKDKLVLKKLTHEVIVVSMTS